MYRSRLQSVSAQSTVSGAKGESRLPAGHELRLDGDSAGVALWRLEHGV